MAAQTPPPPSPPPPPIPQTPSGGGGGGGQMAPVPNPNTNQSVVGAWNLRSELGRGSFAVVWKAQHTKTNELAAVKEVALGKLSHKLRSSLESEIAILKRARHPNIVSLRDLWKSSSRVFIILEYCDGGDLLAYIRARKQLPPRTAMHFMANLGAGLRVLRQNNLVHRDLKPQNLLLSTAKQGTTPIDAVTGMALPVLKIADFGFARNLQPQGLAETLCGSPLYMAPEVLHGQRYDAKADLWSVGAILFEMVSGAPPYGGANFVALLQNIESREAVLPADVAKVSSPNLVSLLRMLLRRSPIERLSFDEFFRHPYMRDAMNPASATSSSSHDEAATIAAVTTSSSSVSATNDASTLDSEYVMVEEDPIPPPTRMTAARVRAETMPALPSPSRAAVPGAAFAFPKPATGAKNLAMSSAATLQSHKAAAMVAAGKASSAPSAQHTLNTSTAAQSTLARLEVIAKQMRDLATEAWERGERTGALSLQMLALRVLRGIADGARASNMQALAVRTNASLSKAIAQAEVAAKRILRDEDRLRALSSSSSQHAQFSQQSQQSASEGSSLSTTRGSMGGASSDCSMESAATMMRGRAGSSNATSASPPNAMAMMAGSPGEAHFSPKAATVATSSSTPAADRVVLPDALELTYQNALRDGRAGAVQELVGVHDVASACYERAVNLLNFLLLDAESLGGTHCQPLSLTGEMRAQLSTYRAGLESRWLGLTTNSMQKRKLIF